MKYAGAAYLIGLGLHALLVRREERPIEVPRERRLRRRFLQGVVVNALNPGTSADLRGSYTEGVIYCVIPRELEAELYEKMVGYYKDNPNVTVIVDRREGDDRRTGREYGGKREIRDRRRARIPGTFPDTEGS